MQTYTNISKPYRCTKTLRTPHLLSLATSSLPIPDSCILNHHVAHLIVSLIFSHVSLTSLLGMFVGYLVMDFLEKEGTPDDVRRQIYRHLD